MAFAEYEGKPVVIRFADGAEYGVASRAVAARVYPTATVVRYQDGTPLEDEEAAGSAVRLADLKRADLEAYAARVGIEGPYGQFKTKADLVAAIEVRLPFGQGGSDVPPADGPVTAPVEPVQPVEPVRPSGDAG